jgi:hypothetical protein
MVNITLLWLLLVPILLPIGVYLVGRKYNSANWVYIPIAILIGVMITTGLFYTGRGMKTDDTDILNGQVVSKSRDEVSCRHSYQCNCRTSCSGSGSSRSCSTVCDTCYEHNHDVDWNVESTVGDFRIDTIDRQGLRQPPRWSIVANGDPVARAHTYTNYVKGVPESIFHNDATTLQTLQAKFNGLIPAYPLGIYDYQYLDRVLAMSVPVADLKQWNTDLAMALRPIGPTKQANVVIIIVKTDDPNYMEALKHAWLQGKKNDVVVVLGTTEYPKISWVGVMSWTDTELFKVELRDAIFDIGTIDRTKIIPAISTQIMKNFNRKHFRDFAYLSSEIDPPDWIIWLAMVLVIVVNGVALFVMWKGRTQSYRRRF